jgi:hypothetical protein
MAAVKDHADDLGEVVAWLRAWEGSDADVKPDARTRCQAILVDTWNAALGHTTVLTVTGIPDAEHLALDLKGVRHLLEGWGALTPEECERQKPTVRAALSKALKFFAAAK